jgi:tRNA pseudouridine38-40 synthase
MKSYRLTVEYEGTRYRGWQEQKRERTVAGELRRAAEAALGVTVDLQGSGRTDAGVHALGQVAHLRAPRGPAPAVLGDEINERLPADIHVLRSAAAPPRFHARHSAVSRAYLYQVSSRRTALAKRFVWWVREPLDTAAMSRAAAALPGRHDLAAFCERAQDQKSTIVVVHGVEIARAGALILVRMSASHFLWKMVRRTVGALVQVGSGALSERDFRLLVETGAAPGAPDVGKWTAPPSGLFLEAVAYDGDPPLGPLIPACPVGSSSES